MRSQTTMSLAAVVIGLALTLGVLPAAAQGGSSRPPSGRDPIYEEPPGRCSFLAIHPRLARSCWRTH
jgi:hypothetical protein